MIEFNNTELLATFMDASGNQIKRVQQVRIDPVTLKKCRITPSRVLEAVNPLTLQKKAGNLKKIEAINVTRIEKSDY